MFIKLFKDRLTLVILAQVGLRSEGEREEKVNAYSPLNRSTTWTDGLQSYSSVKFVYLDRKLVLDPLHLCVAITDS